MLLFVLGSGRRKRFVGIGRQLPEEVGAAGLIQRVEESVNFVLLRVAWGMRERRGRGGERAMKMMVMMMAEIQWLREKMAAPTDKKIDETDEQNS